MNDKANDLNGFDSYLEYNAGVSCFQKGDIIQARKHWKLVDRRNNPIAYAWAQCNLGTSFSVEKNKEQARNHWKQVNKEDNPIAYAFVQYNLGLSFDKEGDIEQAYEHFTNFLNYQGLCQNKNYSGDLRIYYMQRIIICSRNNKLKGISKFLLKLVDFFHNIHQCVMDIQNELHISSVSGKENTVKDFQESVAHYTRVEVAEKIIKKGSFHLGVANYMNDPTEGKILFNEWTIPLDYNDNFMAFLTSFTLNENSLNQFRLYGKQDGKDGSGLSLVLRHQFFNSIFDRQQSFVGNMGLIFGNIFSTPDNSVNHDINKQKLNTKSQLFRCIYINPKTDYVNIAHRNKRSFYFHNTTKEAETVWNKYIQTINQMTDGVKELLKQIKDNIEQIKQVIRDENISKPDEIYKALSTILLPIIYLTKHAAFEEEAECRIVYVTSILDDVIQKDGDRVYVEYGIDLADQYQQDGQSQNYLERIYLGPKADPRAELNLKKCWIDTMREKGMANNDIKIPTIIKSDMPLA